VPENKRSVTRTSGGGWSSTSNGSQDKWVSFITFCFFQILLCV
jgi:hypothetical protein